MATVVINASDISALTAELKKGGQRGGGRRPVDSQTRARVRKMARSGMTRNAIAKKAGLSPSTVSRICAEAKPPISFDRAATAAAVAARTVDLKARRTELSRLLLQDAFALRERAWATKTVTIMTEDMAEKGMEPARFEVDHEPREIQQLFTSVAIAADKHLVLVRHDADQTQSVSDLDAFLAHVAPEGKTA